MNTLLLRVVWLTHDGTILDTHYRCRNDSDAVRFLHSMLLRADRILSVTHLNR